MRSVLLLALLYAVLQVNSLQAQTLNQLSSSLLKPRIGVTILADGKPVDQQTGVRADTKELRFRASIDTTSNDFQSDLLIKNTEAILARNGRKLAQIDISNDRSLTDFVQQAQSSDHLVLKFTLIARRKNGTQIPLPEQPVYNLPIR